MTDDLNTRVKDLEKEMGQVVDILKEISTKLDKLDSLEVALAKNFARLYVHTGIGEKVVLGAVAQDKTVQETQELLERMQDQQAR